MGKTGGLFKKVEETREHFMQAWANRWGKSGNSDRFYFLWLQNHCDCIHEIKRCLLLGRKAMKNLDSILKSKDITLLTKVCIFKAMVFPVLMYGYMDMTVHIWRVGP